MTGRLSRYLDRFELVFANLSLALLVIVLALQVSSDTRCKRV